MPSIEAEESTATGQSRRWLHIAVAVIRDDAGNILISERKPDCAYAGQWEFPGGKVEPDETVGQALAREVEEELGLIIQRARPLICIRHEYPDRRVLLNTWLADRWSGQAESREGQRFAWVSRSELQAYPMLAANRPIIRAVQLPERYLVTPDDDDSGEDFLSSLRACLETGVRLVRLRKTHMSDADYGKLAGRVLALCAEYDARLMVDRHSVARDLSAGLHLPSRALRQIHERPVGNDQWLAASCHTEADLHRAEIMQCDFAVLGPVRKTATHPAVQPLGWERFAALAGSASLPVYPIGGMTLQDLSKAWSAGGQGIAAIRGLWMS